MKYLIPEKQIIALVFVAFFCCTTFVGAGQNQLTPPEKAPAMELNFSTDGFTAVELDSFIEKEKKNGARNKMIKIMAPLSFTAAMKRLPEERQMSYIYTAMELSGVTNLPKIDHRMFIESAEGRIIPVYVEEQAVKKLQDGLREGQKAKFLGYHVYSYAKGPAILVVDFARAEGSS